jgi:hypothetical protein
VGGEWNTFDQGLASLAIGWLVGLRPKEDACKASYLIGQDTDTPWYSTYTPATGKVLELEKTAGLSKAHASACSFGW